MAQRNSPSRRIPDEPLAGILRAVAYQARYSNRRRADVPTVTNSVAAAESAQAASASGVAAMAASVAAPEQRKASPATLVATVPGMPESGVALLLAVEGGHATLQFQDRGSVPSVVATVVADRPAVATVSGLTATAATVNVWGLDGAPLPDADVSVVVLWP